ncbi:MAG: sugar transferase [Gemmatimonadetes bacterium]|nr:sugar transferase [Gemmatimonadota bacterium]
MSAAKRAFDLVAALAGLLVLWPLFLLVALAIKLDDGGSVFFRQTRVGWHGRPFRLWKFRTMVPDAERRGGQLTVGRDPRITRVGYWLRRWKLDELPQLLNVVAGEMSLVGPRPEVPRYVARYTEAQRRVLEVRPGITDPAAIEYCDESELLARADDPERLYVEELLPRKLQMNLQYAREATVWRDVGMVLRTLARLAGRRTPAL